MINVRSQVKLRNHASSLRASYYVSRRRCDRVLPSRERQEQERTRAKRARGRIARGYLIASEIAVLRVDLDEGNQSVNTCMLSYLCVSFCV